ncbi:DUF4402 domain-containing protein [Chitinophaga filiformis]|uniref:DUF4402 domain-containing protein n=1 Tax=Chitinophaga filiformis TaxID=104663 RepID=A0A1G7N2M8_CHIFI|nr:DUF4402 domain-containing protein [Chitinophaga filiformis]SDF68212.1 protein of unknown function [Chitinophaga filiformis]
MRLFFTKYLLYTGLLLLLIQVAQPVHAQEPPPRPISVYVNPAQGLIFGAFFQGVTGGTVTVFPDGSRTVTGSIVQANLGLPFSPAIFEVEANPGTLISIMNGPDVTLTGSNGGTLSLHIGTASTGSQFITNTTPPARTLVRIGGTLTVGPPLANPAGSYSGIFSVTFIQE